jgi:hypothetical protein
MLLEPVPDAGLVFVLGFFIMALTSPLQILFLLIGINKVKKQIAQNMNIINSMEA